MKRLGGGEGERREELVLVGAEERDHRRGRGGVDDGAEIERQLGDRRAGGADSAQRFHLQLAGGLEELFAVDADDRGDRAVGGGVAEDVFQEARGDLARGDQRAREAPAASVRRSERAGSGVAAA